MLSFGAAAYVPSSKVYKSNLGEESKKTGTSVSVIENVKCALPLLNRFLEAARPSQETTLPALEEKKCILETISVSITEKALRKSPSTIMLANADKYSWIDADLTPASPLLTSRLL